MREGVDHLGPPEGVAAFGEQRRVAPQRAGVAAHEHERRCADARRNLVDRDAIVVESTVERWRPPPDPVDAVLADPSRTGLGREAVDALCATAAPMLVLVSCDAGALGRDAALLAERGYAFRRAEMVDAFPHTPHVEVVSRFERKVE